VTITEHEPTTTSTLDEETRRVLATAKGIVAAGWCQGNYTDGEGRYCAAGALGWRFDGNIDDSQREAFTALERLTGVGNLFHWNDAPGRTQQDVIDLIDRALQQ
jgi:hypothetical protein